MMDQATELNLLARVKQQQDSTALTQLINAHTGMYFTIVSRYAHQYPDRIRLADLSDDKLFNMYRFIKDYNPAKDSGMGTGLGSYIGVRTDYMCKDLLKTQGRNPLTATLGELNTDGSRELGDAETRTTGGRSITLIDTTEAGRPQDAANTDICIEDITNAARTACPDTRFLTILRMRHLETPPLSWRKVGDKLGLSHERARQVYDENMTRVRDHLMKPTTMETLLS